MPNWFRLTDAKADENGLAWARIDIYDEIGESTDWWTGDKIGIGATQFVGLLNAIGTVDLISLHINSPGGVINDGWVIYNNLIRNPATVRVYIDGQAASMASVIAMAGDEIIMPSNASYWVHNPISAFFAWTAGYSDDMREIAQQALRLADDLDIAGAAIRATYITRSGGKLDEGTIKRLMDEESTITAQRAVELGLADRIEGQGEIWDWGMADRVKGKFEGVRDSIKALAVRRDAERKRAEPTKPAPINARDLISQLRAAKLEDLAAAAIEAEPTPELADRLIGSCGEARDICAAAGLGETERAPIMAAVGGLVLGRSGPAEIARAVFQAALAKHRPDISGEIDPNRQRAGNVIDYRAIYAARRARR